MRKLIGILWAVPVALAVAGCGGDGDSVDAWLGNWTVAGTQSTTCGNQSGTSQLSGLVAIIAGPMSGTIRTLGGDCTNRLGGARVHGHADDGPALHRHGRPPQRHHQHDGWDDDDERKDRHRHGHGQTSTAPARTGSSSR
jgi:hypothetical protein